MGDLWTHSRGGKLVLSNLAYIEIYSRLEESILLDLNQF